MTRLSSRLRLFLIALVGYLVLLLPASFNGAPVYWPDSIAYLHGGSTSLAVTVGIETEYSSIERARPDSSVATEPNKSASSSEAPQVDIPAARETTSRPRDSYRVSAARSPYYATFLTGVSSAIGHMGPVYLQALLVLLALGFVIKAVLPENPEKTALLLVCAISLTTAGFFATVLLPDIFAPLGLLAAAMLFAFQARLSRLEWIFWYSLLVISVLCHTTHLAMVLFLLPWAFVLTKIIADLPVLRPTLLVLSAVGIGIIGQFVFVQMVERHYGYKPQSFPMIAASIIVDGTGRTYLEQTCPENGYIYCDYLDSEATEVDQFLWSSDPEVGVYSLADRTAKDRLSAEQWSFLIDTLRHGFLKQCVASLKRLLRQITNNSVTQFYYNEDMKNELLNLPVSDRESISQSALFRKRFPLATLSSLSQWIGWVALVALLIIVARPPNAASAQQSSSDVNTQKGLILLTVLILIGFVINAGLTGAASQPQGRYSARVLLLFPVLLSVWISFIHNSTHRYAYRTP